MDEQMKMVRETIEKNLIVPEIDLSLVSKETIEKELSKHEVAYLEAIVAVQAEKKFLDDSIDEIEKMAEENPNGLETARKHLDASKKTANYFQQTKVDPSCYKALGHLQNIEAKLQEVKAKLWGVEYHSKKIVDVKAYLATK